jgi:hypothetical protein
MSDQHFESLLLGSNNDSATAKLPQIGGVVGHVFLCFIFYNFLLSVKVVPNNLNILNALVAIRICFELTLQFMSCGHDRHPYEFS